MPEVCIIGSLLSHGGSVIEGSDKTFYNGSSVARIGDKAMCSRHGQTVIIDAGQTTVNVDDRLVAVNGAKTSCGAIVLGPGYESVYCDG
jgi:uncharacterized Zn-binding protein involved in type VI secretion